VKEINTKGLKFLFFRREKREGSSLPQALGVLFVTIRLSTYECVDGRLVEKTTHMQQEV
jgi:hypothetical protein